MLVAEHCNQPPWRARFSGIHVRTEHLLCDETEAWLSQEQTRGQRGVQSVQVSKDRPDQRLVPRTKETAHSLRLNWYRNVSAGFMSNRTSTQCGPAGCLSYATSARSTAALKPMDRRHKPAAPIHSEGGVSDRLPHVRTPGRQTDRQTEREREMVERGLVCSKKGCGLLGGAPERFIWKPRGKKTAICFTRRSYFTCQLAVTSAGHSWVYFRETHLPWPTCIVTSECSPHFIYHWN